MQQIFYHETLTSRKTSALFIALALVFLGLFLWRELTAGFDGIAITLLVFFFFFLFYVFNYRKLEITLEAEGLQLKFGIFHYQVLYNNIASVRPDQIPAILRLGGAGIHFMSVYGRYRMSMNFLEHPRILVEFRHKVGPVRDLSFSTQSPDQLIDAIIKILQNK